MASWYFLCAVQEIRCAKFVEDLHRNLTFLHKRSAELAKDLQKHHQLIWDQINEIRRIEVSEIDACARILFIIVS